MAQTAAYSGLRWGELAALTAGQVRPAVRVITVGSRRSAGSRTTSARTLYFAGALHLR